MLKLVYISYIGKVLITNKLKTGIKMTRIETINKLLDILDDEAVIKTARNLWGDGSWLLHEEFPDTRELATKFIRNYL